jgi:hypothetical protein
MAVTIVRRTPFIHFRIAVSTFNVVTSLRIVSMSASRLKRFFAFPSSTTDNELLSAAASLILRDVDRPEGFENLRMQNAHLALFDDAR